MINFKSKQSHTFMERFGWGVLAIQAITSFIAVGVINKTNIFIMRYFLIACGVVLVLFLLMSVWIIKTKGVIARVISLLLSVALLFGSFYAIKTHQILKNITGGNTDTHLIHIVVKKENNAQIISDVVHETFGGNTTLDEKAILKAKSIIEGQEDVDLVIKDYDRTETLINDLYDERIKVMIISDGQIDLANEVDENFEENTRILATYQFDQEVVKREQKPSILKDTYSIFLSGIDKYGPVSTVSRSDVNMILTINPKTHQILLTSIPRDYFVRLATSQAMDKLTHAGLYGVEESMNTLAALFGIDIDYYIRVNFTSVNTTVDALGGVDIYTKYTFTTRGGLYSFQEGMNSLNGASALAFARERYAFTGGDNVRVYHQQQLIQGILNKAISPAIITRYASVLDSVSDSIETSLSEDELTAIIRDQMDSMKQWDVQQYQVSGTGTYRETYSWKGKQLYVMIPNESTVQKAAAYIHQMENGDLILVEE